MAATVLRDAARQLDVALSSGQNLVQLQLAEHGGCLDRLLDLHADISTGRTPTVASRLVHDTGLSLKLGAVLGRVLEQSSSPTRWQDCSHCRLVRQVATVLKAVLTLPDGSSMSAVCKRDPVIAQQLAASSLLPNLAAALPQLTSAVQAATELRPCIQAAQAVVAAAFGILSVWPGQTGVLSSKAAGPLVQPTLQLLVALFQHAVATGNVMAFSVIADTTMMGIPNLAQQMLLQKGRMLNGQGQLRDHPCLKQLVDSSAFLTLLLTVSCFILHSAPPAAAAATDEPPSAAAAVGTHRAASAEQHERGGCSTRLHTDSVIQGAERIHADTAAAGSAVLDPAEAQLQAEQRFQLTQVLQTLYSTPTASNWEPLLAREVPIPAGWHGMVMLGTVWTAAAECLQEHITRLQQVATYMDASTANSSSKLQSNGLLPPHQLFLETHASTLHAVRQLPVLVLQCVCSATTQAAARAASAAEGVHRAAITLINQIISCWQLQLQLRSSGVGIQPEQLPCAELLKLLLQQMKVLQQLRADIAAAPATAQSAAATGAAGCGGIAAAADTTSAAAVAAERVALLDVAMVDLLEVLTVLQTGSQWPVWQPHFHNIAAAVEYCLRCITSGSVDNVVVLFVHHALCTACESFFWLEDEADTAADSEQWSEVRETGVLLQAAATTAAGSHQQQQLFTLLVSLLKSSSHFQQSGPAARELGDSHVAVAKIINQVFEHMLSTLRNDSSSSCKPSAAAELLHGMQRSRVLCGTAPWLVASSRLVYLRTTQLVKSLAMVAERLDVRAAIGSCNSSSGYSSSSAAAQTAPGTDAAEQVEGDCLRFVLDCSESVVCSAVYWVDALEQCCSLLQESIDSTDCGHNSAGTDRDAGAAFDGDTYVMASTPAAAVGAAAQMALAAVSDAVQDLQQAQMQEACRALRSDPEPVTPRLWAGLGDLQRVCSAGSPEWQLETKAGKHFCWDIPDMAAAGMLPAQPQVFDVGLFRHVVEQRHLKQMLQDLSDVSQRVCAALPLKSCCNKPSCSNVSSSSEWALVSGKGCVCARCETARYCSKECQVAHWPWHKAICNAIKKQNRARQQGCNN